MQLFYSLKGHQINWGPVVIINCLIFNRSCKDCLNIHFTIEQKMPRRINFTSVHIYPYILNKYLSVCQRSVCLRNHREITYNTYLMHTVQNSFLLYNAIPYKDITIVAKHQRNKTIEPIVGCNVIQSSLFVEVDTSDGLWWPPMEMGLLLILTSI